MPLKALVTGGTGFVGAHVVRALLADGASVRCLVRGHSDLANLDGLEVDLVVGDLRDRESLEVALAGSEALFHCAADYRLGVRDPAELYRSNVEGTRNLLEAARACGVRRVVHTSSVGALGLLAGGEPADEETPVRAADLVGPYKRSKHLSEEVALEMARSGLDVVVVNPSTPVGELDRKPTPTGQMIVDFLCGRMPAYVHTGLNLIDVRDVAAGHLLACRDGRRGERYILGHQNLTLREILALLAEITGRPAPRLRLPHAAPLVAAAASELSAPLSGGEARLPLASGRMSRTRMWFDASNAVRELGLPQSPIRPALERAVEFFRATGQAPVR